MMLSTRLWENNRRRGTDYPLLVYDVVSRTGKDAIQAHWHEEAEILYANCSGILEINAQTIRYEPGDILFVNKESLHKAAALSDGNLFAVLFPYEFLDFKLKDRCQVTLLDRLEASEWLFPAALHPQDAVYDSIRTCLLEIVDLYFGNVKGKELKMKIGLYQLLFLCYANDILESSGEKESPPQVQTVQYVKTVIAYMEKHLEKPVTVEDMARQAGIHKNYLIRIFRQITGMTPIVYLRKLRLENSAHLLINGATVTQAALMSGFNTISYYIKTFKDVYVVSPKKFGQGGY